MIGFIMVTLVTQWFVIFFEAKEVCADLLNRDGLTGMHQKTKLMVRLHQSTKAIFGCRISQAIHFSHEKFIVLKKKLLNSKLPVVFLLNKVVSVR